MESIEYIEPTKYVEGMKVRLLITQIDEETYKLFGNRWGIVEMEDEAELYVGYDAFSNNSTIVELRNWQVTHHDFGCDCHRCWPGT